MKMFIGLDVSLEKTTVCILNDQGDIVKETEVVSEPEPLVEFLQSLYGEVVQIGLEAGPLSQWLYRGLVEAGFSPVLMETRHVKGALKSMPIKTDRRDAEGIARLLHIGWVRPVHCKSVSAQEIRALLTARRSVNSARINLELSVRGVLRNFGLKLGRTSNSTFEARVRELIAERPMLEAAIIPILEVRRELRGRLLELEKVIRDLAKSEPVCRLLMTMPGVGAVIALTFCSAVDHPERFRRSKDIGPWAGLTPRRSQSGERDIVGSVTRAGDSGLRVALYQAATSMLHHGAASWLKAWALRLAKRRGQKRATVALARRIGVVLHRMWMDGTEFRFTRDEAGVMETA